MTGVASRKVNRAASSRDSPRNMPATIATPYRLAAKELLSGEPQRVL
jgi:hypothetical protein